MTAGEILDSLFSNSLIIMSTLFIISLAVFIPVLPNDRERTFKAVILAIAVSQFLCLLPIFWYATYAVLDKPAISQRIVRSVLFSLLFYPQSIPLLVLCLIILKRHSHCETRSYKVETIVATLIAMVGAVWTSGVGAYLISKES